ncbi:MAG: hypothetical protein IPP99_12290 [Chitinophagaceae bacterium]|nr:hypothetical protein [Chitinophagaceae bacterium]
MLQSGALGRPIVCTNIEGSVDIVTYGETGLIFQPGQAVDLDQKPRYAPATPG